MFRKLLEFLFGKREEQKDTIPVQPKVEEGKQEKWVIDPPHAQVIANVVHMELVDIEGRFDKIEGEITATPPTFGDLQVKAIIHTDSFSTGAPARDAHVKSPDFLDVEKYPTIEFESTGITWKPLNRFVLNGNLTIKGVTKPISIEGKLTKFINKDVFGLKRAAFEGETTIKRSEFGVLWEGEKNMKSEDVTQILDDNVKIKLAVEITQPQIFEAYKQMGITI